MLLARVLLVAAACAALAACPANGGMYLTNESGAELLYFDGQPDAPPLRIAPGDTADIRFGALCVRLEQGETSYEFPLGILPEGYVDTGLFKARAHVAYTEAGVVEARSADGPPIVLGPGCAQAGATPAA